MELTLDVVVVLDAGTAAYGEGLTDAPLLAVVPLILLRVFPTDDAMSTDDPV